MPHCHIPVSHCAIVMENKCVYDDYITVVENDDVIFAYFLSYQCLHIWYLLLIKT